ncbi:MAG: LPS export ABC transporter periplasmic protein LptC [Thiohalorhabdus sp.]|uniref:LPS export ABC transporter periplasmic protein LptC n=1 Tax=Thiohalorhabdus sp. TaxID=3094134 RepID=UPI002FC3AEFB
MQPQNRSSPRPLLATLLLALGLGLALTLLWQDGDKEERDGAREAPEMDAEIWGVELRQRDGERRWQLRADYAAHYPGPGVTRLRPVRLEVLRSQGSPLTADAQRGRVADADNAVTLMDEVVVVEPGAYRLTTDTLHYLPEANRAETSDPVTVTADFGEATGIGATLWTRSRRVELHTEVTTNFWRRPDDAP